MTEHNENTETELSQEDAVKEYTHRLNVAEEIYGNLTERERDLVREASIMSFVRGVQFTGGLPEGQTFPSDEVILIDTLFMTTQNQEAFPALGTYPVEE